MAWRGDIGVGIAGVALAGLYWWGADAIPTSPLDGGVGAAGMPKALAWALGGLAVLLVLRSGIGGFVEARAASRIDPTAAVAGGMPAPEKSWRAHWRALVMLALGIGYVALIDWLGYSLTVLLLFGAVALFNGARASWRMATIAVGMSLLFYLLFVQFLSIPLPAGIWPTLRGG